jgi:hypothetical protein
LEEGRIEEQKFRRNWTESSLEKLKARGAEADFYFGRWSVGAESIGLGARRSRSWEAGIL